MKLPVTFAVNLIASLFILGAALPAHAATMASMNMPLPTANKQVCQVYGPYKKASSRVTPEAQNDCSNSAISKGYVAFRIEPMSGWSNTPVCYGEACYYVSNNSTQSFFIPAANSKDFDQFVNHHPAAIGLWPAVAPKGQALNAEQLCNGGLLTTNGVYKDGFAALSTGKAGEVRSYYVVDQNNKLLRQLTATGVKGKGWVIGGGVCANADSSQQTSSQTGKATPAVFDRNSSPSTAQPGQVAAAAPAKPTLSPAALAALEPASGPVAPVVTKPATPAAPMAPVATPAAQPTPQAAAPAAFNANTASTTRVYINDGALKRGIQD